MYITVGDEELYLTQVHSSSLIPTLLCGNNMGVCEPDDSDPGHAHQHRAVHVAVQRHQY